MQYLWSFTFPWPLFLRSPTPTPLWRCYFCTTHLLGPLLPSGGKGACRILQVAKSAGHTKHDANTFILSPHLPSFLARWAVQLMDVSGPLSLPGKRCFSRIRDSRLIGDVQIIAYSLNAPWENSGRLTIASVTTIHSRACRSIAGDWSTISLFPCVFFCTISFNRNVGNSSLSPLFALAVCSYLIYN